VTSIVDSLVADASTFDFFQALRLIEQCDGLRATIHPHDGLSFPASDVHSATVDDSKLDLVVTFFGLYGVDSPLPSYFGDRASDEESSALRAFLDIFGHRLYVLLYRSWKKYRTALGTAEDMNRNLNRLACLAGLGAHTPAELETSLGLIPHAATLRSEIRNADGLAGIIRASFPGLQLQIVENVPRRVTITDRPRLGRAGERVTLGDSGFLGEALLDASGQFRIVLGPVSPEQFEAFHPQGASAKTLAALVAMYVRDALAYDVELRVKADELPRTRLRCPANRLGLTTWVGRPSRTTVSEIVEYGEQLEGAQGATRPKSTARFGRRTIQ
jgi:type VI secretion system protein ImpH